MSGNEMLVRSLILAGARVNDTDANRNTALHVAAKAGCATVVSALLQVRQIIQCKESETESVSNLIAFKISY